jgi:competence protein ComGC
MSPILLGNKSRLTAVTDPEPVEQPLPAAANSRLSRIQEWATLVRDLGVIVGIPTIIAVGLQLHDIQEKSFEAQVKANEAQIKSLEAQNSVLKETQYDRALSLIKSQSEVFEIERDKLSKQISDLRETVRQSEAKITENTEGLIKKQNQETEAKLQALDETLKSKEAVFQALIESLKGKNIKPP